MARSPRARPRPLGASVVSTPSTTRATATTRSDDASSRLAPNERGPPRADDPGAVAAARGHLTARRAEVGARPVKLVDAWSGSRTPPRGPEGLATQAVGDHLAATRLSHPDSDRLPTLANSCDQRAFLRRLVAKASRLRRASGERTLAQPTVTHGRSSRSYTDGSMAAGPGSEECGPEEQLRPGDIGQFLLHGCANRLPRTTHDPLVYGGERSHSCGSELR